MDCYWRKCTFCNICRINDRRTRPSNSLQTTFKKISPYSRYETARIGSLAIPPSSIEEWFPKIILEQNVNFDFYIRPDHQTTKALTKSLPTILQQNKASSIYAHLGIEFLSNRILKIMKKGLIVNDIEESVLLLRSYNINMVPTIIVGWPELKKEDVINLEKKIKIFEKNQKCYIYCLVVDNFMPLVDTYPPPGYHQWYPVQSSSAYTKVLNLEALSILNNHLSIVGGTEIVKERIIGKTFHRNNIGKI
jgi:radical SAM superfamily enzyme YgiQ (UPF0313 family)